MQSSFIDIGLERDAFLYVTEVINTVEEFERLAGDDDDDDEDKKAHAAVRLPDPAAEGAQAAAEGALLALDPQAPVIAAKPAEPRGGDRRGRDRDRDRDQPQAKIEDLLKEGQEILVQVGQGAARHQGARPHLARHDAGPVPGLHADGRSRRRLAQDRVARGALAPAATSSSSSARRTDSPAASSSAPPRAAAPRPDIVSDLSYFHEIWTEVRRKMENRRPPAVLFQEQSLGHQAPARHAHRRLHGDPASTIPRSIAVSSPCWSGSCRRRCRA
jgi:ribonuclease G